MSSGDALRPLLLGMGWPTGQVGGLNRYLADLFAALADAGVAPQAVVLGPAPGAPAGVVVAADAGAALPRRLLAYTRAARRDAGVIDAHFALYALPTVLLRSREIPLVVHFQGPWADESVSAGRTSPLAAAARRSWERAVYRRADRIVTLTAAFRRLLVERYGVPPWHVEVIPPSVDLERFSPGDRSAARARLGLPHDAWVAVTARRLVPRMGIDVLLEAWAAQATRRGSELLVIVGEGAARDALERRAAEADLAGRVLFYGRVDDETLVDCYRAADVVVVPSVALEGYGLVVLEALACGTAIVASDSGGLLEAAAPLDEGLVVPAGDHAALAARLAAARDGTDPLPSPSACRAYAERHSPQELAARHLEVYRRAAARSERIRVVYVGHTARLSGGELALLRLAPALQHVDVHVILAEDGPLVRRLERAGVSVEVLPLPATTRDLRRERVSSGPALLLHALSTAVYALHLARRLRRLRPDLVHTNSLKAAVYGGFAGRIVGIPVVWHLRDRIAEDYLPRPAVALVRLLARVLPRAVVANSQATLATLEGRPSTATVVASPVLAGDRPPRPRAGRPFRVAIVGRIAPWKGQDVFLDAFAQAFPSGDERAVVAGAPLFGEADYDAGLREQAARLGIADRVEFSGFVDDVEGLLRSVDVVVHASVLPEPFGQVVVEGLAAGAAVVAARAGGPAEILTDGVDGLLYEPGNVAALAERLARLADDDALRSRLSLAGGRRALDFTPERIAAEIEAVYERVLRGAA